MPDYANLLQASSILLLLGKKCLQPSLFRSTSPIEGLYDDLIKKLTGAMHNLLSSLLLWPLGRLRMEQCLLSKIVRKRAGSPGGELEEMWMESSRCATDGPIVFYQSLQAR